MNPANLCLFEDDREIVTTKSEGITQRHFHFTFLCLDEREVESGIQVWIIIEMVYRGWHDGLVNCQQAGYAFNCARRAQ